MGQFTPKLGLYQPTNDENNWGNAINQNWAVLDNATPSKHTPATATDTGITGQVVWDDNYIYICIAPNTWKRAVIAGW